VNCSLCGRGNRDDARFCDACGRPLGAAPERDLRGYTPPHLADRILTTRSALEGERKQVTVLFADIEDSTALSRRIGVEAWHRVLDAYFRILAGGVHRFEGTINQFTGDGIMALFGAPVAHEDHAERACHAALALARELERFAESRQKRDGVRVSVRIGLNSGDVVVGKIGDDLRMDYTAQGHTVALAARIQETAPAGGVALSEHTARLVEGFFALRDLGAAVPKGFSEPVRMFALESEGPLRTRLDRARARGLSPLVGRGRELAALEAALEQSRAGNAQAIGLVGEAGIGKSRLAFEFAERCRREELTVCEAHCPAHGATLPLHLVAGLLRGYFGVAGSEAPAAAREKVTRGLATLGSAFAPMLPLVGRALSLDESPRGRPPSESEERERLAEFLRRWVQAASAQKPLVLLLDDLHWIDPRSHALLGELVEAMGWTRTLLVANYRPEYRAEWLRGSYARSVALAPLGSEERRALRRDLLGDDASLVDFARQIDTRAGGNPLFIEEIVRAASSAGRLEGEPGAYRLVRTDDSGELPATVQAVLAGRIDRLGEREKLLLQQAAVIGSPFDITLLGRVSGVSEAECAESLGRLVELGFVASADAAYAFHHPLVQEVAYHSQLESQRAALHAGVARALEAIHAERIGEKSALIAHHWDAAGHPREAARWRARAALRVSRIQLRRRGSQRSD
jgi:class 3 adenylate cyclase